MIWIDDDIAAAIRSGEIEPDLVNDPRLVMISPTYHRGINARELAVLRALVGLDERALSTDTDRPGPTPISNRRSRS